MGRRRRSAFRAEEIVQDECPLFARLPAELRLVVLKELLMSEEPIGYCNGMNSGEEQDANELCPSLLGACQTMYHEGLDVYRRNVVALRLDVTVTNQPLVIHKDTGPLNKGFRMSDFARRDDGKHILKYFDKLELYIEEPRDLSNPWDDIQDIFRHIRSHIGDKDIRFRLNPWATSLFDPRTPDGLSVVGLFELIRCRSFQLLDHYRVPIQSQICARIASLVESKKPIVDLPARAKRLTSHLTRSRISAGLAPSQQGLWIQINQLEDAARKFQFQLFSERRDDILRRIEHFDSIAKQKHIDLDDELQNYPENDLEKFLDHDDEASDGEEEDENED